MMFILWLVGGFIPEGPQAMGWNPALIYTEGWTINLLTLEAEIFNNCLPYSELMVDKIDEPFKQKLLQSMPLDGFMATGELSGHILCIAYKNVGFAVKLRGSGRLYLAKELLDLLLIGNELNRTYEIHSEPMDNQANLYYDVGIGVSVPFELGNKQLKVGVGFHIYRGLYYIGVERVDFIGRTTENYIYGNGDVSAKISESGSGYGMDFGITIKQPGGWEYGVSITEIGNLVWDKGEQKEWTYELDSFALDMLDSLEEIWLTEYEVTEVDEFTTTLPTICRAYAKYDAGDWKFGTVLDYQLYKTAARPKGGEGIAFTIYEGWRWIDLGVGVGYTYKGIAFIPTIRVKLPHFYCNISLCSVDGIYPWAKGVAITLESTIVL